MLRAGASAPALLVSHMLARHLLSWTLLAASANLMADETGYRLWLDTSTSGRTLIVVPHIVAPAAARLRYEIVSTKRGRSGKSDTRQSGTIAVDAQGSGTFAKLSLGVDADDRYTIAVKVYDGVKLVAEQSVDYPR
jgi:thin aggregative fimbriae synthesis protein